MHKGLLGNFNEQERVLRVLGMSLYLNVSLIIVYRRNRSIREIKRESKDNTEFIND